MHHHTRQHTLRAMRWGPPPTDRGWRHWPRRDAPAEGEPAHGRAGGTGGTPPAGGGGEGGKAADDTGTGEGGKKPTIQGDLDPDRAARAIASAREAEKAAKAAAKASDDKLAAVLKTLGLTPDGKADPEKQAKELTDRAEKAERRARQLATREAVRTAAAKHSGNVEALLDSQSLMAQLSDLDPDASDYADKVGDVVKAAVKDNDRFKQAPASGQGPARMGAEHTGSGGGGKQRPTSLGAAITAAYQS